LAAATMGKEAMVARANAGRRSEAKEADEDGVSRERWREERDTPPLELNEPKASACDARARAPRGGVLTSAVSMAPAYLAAPLSLSPCLAPCVGSLLSPTVGSQSCLNWSCKASIVSAKSDPYSCP
jgi:hypothetical protein